MTTQNTQNKYMLKIKLGPPHRHPMRLKTNWLNLKKTLQQTLLQLKSNKHHTIKPTDKNLGPTILDTSSYIKQVLEKHLLTKDYVQISTAEAKNKIDNIKQIFKTLLQSYRNVLSKPESLYFQCSLQLSHRLAVFYGASEST